LNTTGLDSQYIGQKLIVSYHLEQGWSDNFIGTVEEAPPAPFDSLGIPNPSFEDPTLADGTYAEGAPSGWFTIEPGLLHRTINSSNLEAQHGSNVYYSNYFTEIAAPMDDIIQDDKLYTIKWWVHPLNPDYGWDFYYHLKFWAYEGNPADKDNRTLLSTVTIPQHYTAYEWRQMQASWDSSMADASVIGKKLMISYMLERGWSDNFVGTVEDIPQRLINYTCRTTVLHLQPIIIPHRVISGR
jgi:hypothetical protein